MDPIHFSLIVSFYFLLLLAVSYFTTKKAKPEAFYTANRNSPWYLVAFGMIGASLSGVTFISVPGEVGNSYFYYYQMVIGYLLGYFVIAHVLLPLYYRKGLVTIYSYLSDRFGPVSYKTGSAFFILSKAIGAAFRLFLVATVLQVGFFNSFGVPFWANVLITLLLIWLYTFRGGIKTIVFTDALQTFFMLASVVVSIFIIARSLDFGVADIVTTVKEHSYSRIFEWDWKHKMNFFKQFFAGAFIAIVMTGLDQDMMQKNLTCRTLKDSQKNMIWLSIILLPVNLLFMSLGVMLYVYAAKMGIALPERSDNLFPILALHHFSLFAGVVFLLGIIAAAFSSADSALTALTTTFCVDFLKLDIHSNQKKDKTRRFAVHIAFSLFLCAIIIAFRLINDESVINSVFKAAGYTYGPLLGMFAFGLTSKVNVKDRYVWVVACLSPALSWILSTYSQELLFGYQFGHELLIINGAFTYLGLWILKRNKVVSL